MARDCDSSGRLLSSSHHLSVHGYGHGPSGTHGSTPARDKCQHHTTGARPEAHLPGSRMRRSHSRPATSRPTATPEDVTTAHSCHQASLNHSQGQWRGGDAVGHASACAPQRRHQAHWQGVLDRTPTACRRAAPTDLAFNRLTLGWPTGRVQNAAWPSVTLPPPALHR
jgi:hypothetical protein